MGILLHLFITINEGSRLVCLWAWEGGGGFDRPQDLVIVTAILLISRQYFEVIRMQP